MCEIFEKKFCRQSVLWIFVLFIFENSSSLTTDTIDYKKVLSCPKDFIKLGRKCYFFSPTPETWSDAHFECFKRNSSLTSIVNKGQEKVLRKYVDRRFSNDRHERWIDGRYNEKLHIWVWGTSGKPLKYQNFGTNTSNDLTWNCIFMDPNLDNKWNSKKCTESKPYICQSPTTVKIKRKSFDIRKCDYELELTRADAQKCLKLRGFVGQHPNEPAAFVRTTQPTILAQSRRLSYVCPENMYLIGKKCYFFSKIPKSWHEAHYDCQENETSLAIITNKKHDFKIREFLTDGFVLETDRWIGGLYDEGEKRFKWLNGHPLVYKGFARAGLRNKDKKYSAIYMDPSLQYRWNLSNKMSKKMFICQTNAKTIVMVGGYKRRPKLRKPDATITILAANDIKNNI